MSTRQNAIIYLILIVLGVCLPVKQAEATLITIEIEAVVDSVEDDGPDDGYLDGQISPGDTITGHYTYESTTPDSSPSDPVQGNYWHDSPPAGISLSVGS